MRNLPYATGSETDSKKTSETDKNVLFTWGVKIPMRDGVTLNANLYQPRTSEPLPAIFTLTPYIADSYHERAYYFAQHGYTFALIDCRGRGNSGGHFEPFINEEVDAYDIVEWLAGQPWCNGAVSMWGGSYAGFDQWMAVKAKPMHLKTIVPVASAHAGVDFPFFKNIFFPYEIQWQTFISGVTGNANLFGESSFWIAKFREMYLEHRPFQELDQIVGNLSTHFLDWIQHPTQDSFYDQMALTPNEYDRIDIPILTITGHYDGDQPGALTYYQQHMASSSPAKDQHYLLIGPWDHPGTRTPKKEFGGLSYGEASLVDMNKLHKDWYDWILKAGSKPEFLKDRVACYVMGAEEWKYASRIEDLANSTVRLYLNSTNAQANDVFHSGSLQETIPQDSQPDKYVYDPLDTRFADLDKEEISNIYTDERYELNLFGNGLVYHSAPFETDTEITGWINLSLWIALDVPDTDFQAVVSEILPDGKHIQLTQDILRARYRESLRYEKLVIPGEINQYTFTGFTFFSRRVVKGSRLRLLINCPNSIYLEKN
jgi:putative CocE/NonD family hydrolase